MNSIFAQDAGGSPPVRSSGGKLKNPLSPEFSTISGFLKGMLDVVVTIATPIVVLMLVYSGFLFVKAQGKPEELAKAKQAIMWTIIGAVVVLGASVLASAIEGTVDDLTGNSVSEFERTQTLRNYGLPAETKFDPTKPESVFNKRN
jgi:heme/copper-type cytochrome/quinol oxidase subunit 2